MKKLTTILCLLLLYMSGCTLMESNTHSIGINLSNNSRAIEITDIELFSLTVTGQGMVDISKETTTNSINVDVDNGTNRIFSVNLKLTNGDVYRGTTTKDITPTTTLVDIAVELVSEKEITAFNFQGFDNLSEIVGTDISIVLPYGTDITNLVPEISYIGSSISPNPGVETDFTESVTYTVTATDSSTEEYTVTVTAALSDQKEITGFSFVDITADVVISGTDISVNVPYGTDLKTLIPEIIYIGSSINPNTRVATDFTESVIYTVTAEDSSPAYYTVNVSLLSASGITLTSPTINAIDLGESLYVTFGDDILAFSPIGVPSGADLLWYLNGTYLSAGLSFDLTSTNLKEGQNILTCEYTDTINREIGYGEVFIDVMGISYYPTGSILSGVYDESVSELNMSWNTAADNNTPEAEIEYCIVNNDILSTIDTLDKALAIVEASEFVWLKNNYSHTLYVEPGMIVHVVLLIRDKEGNVSMSNIITKIIP